MSEAPDRSHDSRSARAQQAALSNARSRAASSRGGSASASDAKASAVHSDTPSHQNFQQPQRQRQQHHSLEDDRSNPRGTTGTGRLYFPPPSSFLQPAADRSALSTSETSDIFNDDSFSEERFVSAAGSIHNTSWESYSFDSEERPRSNPTRPSSRTSSVRDRRKQFDTTTPTLIDEEDVDDREAEAELLSLEQLGPRTYDEKDDVSLRRTPGATMYKSNLEEAPSSSATAAAEMRRTPGATVMHRSGHPPAAMPTVATSRVSISTEHVAVKATAILGQDDVVASGLGFGLALSTPVGEDQSTKGNARIWESFSSHSQSPSPGHGARAATGATSGLELELARHQRHQQQQQQQQQQQFSRPPLGQSKSALSASSTVTSAHRTQNQDLGGPFSSATWTRSALGSGADSMEGRTGAFSPNILRLTEDIGNLLQDDEDDPYALEIPAVFRGETEQLTEFAEDWTGSYVFDPDLGNRRTTKPIIPRPTTALKEGKTRRRPTSGQGTIFPHAQQPMPQRTGNEVFEFGASRGDERASPQLLNFGGAFAPPLNNAAFMRPVASSAIEAGRNDYAMGLGSSGHQGSFSAGPPSFGGGFQSRTFESIHFQLQQGSGTGFYRQPMNAYEAMGNYVPSGTFHLGGPFAYGPAQSSEMQATAREFVPMATRSITPQYPLTLPQQQQQPWPQGAQIIFDPTSEQSSWHSSPGFAYNPAVAANYGYPMPPLTAGSHTSMSPSPHLPATSWHSTEPIVSGDSAARLHTFAPEGIPPPQHEHNQGFMVTTTPPAPTVPVPPPAPPSLHPVATAGVAPDVTPVAASAVTSNPESLTSAMAVSRAKKETKRGKRGKKKQQQPQAVSSFKQSDMATSVAKAKSGTAAIATIPGVTGTIVKKPKGKVDVLPRPGSTAPSHDGNETLASASEVESKKADHGGESPSNRIAFKDFYRSFRGEERLSFQKAEEFALGALDDGSLPDSVHWRVYLELADLAKRSNRYAEARRLYQKVCQLQPYESQGWLEYSKLEEECGHMNRVTNIVHAGLEYCEHSENLLTRAVKHQEKMGNLANARGLLARLKHVGIERVWRTVLEGALLEGRAGNFATARRVLKYLMHHVPWYGPLYLEAYRLERDQGHPMDALQIVERGLNAIPRYGPLWFGSFRLCEEVDLAEQRFKLPRAMEMVERAKVSISKELVWKVHLEAAQMLERAALSQASTDDASLHLLMVPARHRLALTILTCPNNLRWKVWLAGARMELGIGKIDAARALFSRSHSVVPEKGRSATLLECARLEEFIGDTELARAVLCKGRVEFGHDWKVWLEAVLLEIRNDSCLRAFEICSRALEIHQGTGRLWASLVQLSFFTGRDAAQYLALKRALNVVPKSGEVWCEGGRIHLNPFSDTFDPERARRHLYFATKFTPQYGDSFIETLRWEILHQWLLPVADFIWEKTSSSISRAEVNSEANEESLVKYIADISLAVAMSRQKDTDKESSKSFPRISHKAIIPALRKRLKVETLRSSIDLNDLRLACSNADPNYGALWFQCRRGATDTPRRVIEDGAGDIADELHRFAHVYLAASIRRKAILFMNDLEQPSKIENAIEAIDPSATIWEDRVDEALRNAPSLENIFNPVDPSTGIVLLESTITGRLFVTGLSEMNRHQAVSSMPLGRRRRALFGNDALFP